MNRVLLTGRLTRDPELRTLASGKTVTQFSIATNDYRGGQEKAEYQVKVKVSHRQDGLDPARHGRVTSKPCRARRECRRGQMPSERCGPSRRGGTF